MTHNSNPEFSILMANYNNGIFIRDAIESVIAQSFSNWELIIVDDGSTDDSVRIVSEFMRHDERIRLFQNDRNRGCGFTKRRCAEEAKGFVLAFLDPDDSITPDALEKLYPLHNAKPACSIIYSTHYLCNENREIFKVADNVGQIPFGESHAALPYTGPQISAFASFKKILYDKTEGINPKLKRAVDTDLYLKLEEVGECFYYNEPLYYYRHHKNSISIGENCLKARYWHYLVCLYTYKRRKQSKPEFSRRLTLSELNQIRLDYFSAKAYQKAVRKEWLKMYYCLAQALPSVYLDYRMVLLRIAIVPLKTIFSNKYTIEKVL